MRALIDRLWAQLREYLGKMSRANKIRLGVLSGVIIVLAIVAVSLLSRTNFVTLHVSQDLAEAGQIQASLREMNIPMQIEGLRILVPEERVSEIRATLSAEGIIGPAGMDWSMIPDAAGFAVTENHANRIYDMQLSENIRRFVLLNPRIQNAHVLARRGETSPFRAAQGVRAPSAAVGLVVRGGDRLSNQEVQAIADYIRGAVPGIGFENIQIVDVSGPYRFGDNLTIDAESEMANRIMFQNLITDEIRMTAEQMLIPIFGINNIRITPNIRLNWDLMASEEVVFSPPVAGELQGMHRSAVDSWEAARQDGLAIGIPGTDSNELGTGGVAEYPFGTLEDGELYERRISERNYELNQLVTTISHAQGRVESVSIAVLVNANAIDGDFSEEVSELVTFGFGIPASNVTVQSVPFSYIDTTFEAMFADMEAVRQQERTRELIALIIQWAVILLLGILVILLIRTIFKSLNPPAEPEPIMVSGSMGIDYIADDDDDDISMIESIEYEEVDLQTKLPGLEQIERFIDKDPAAVAQLLRNWLSDE